MAGLRQRDYREGWRLVCEMAGSAGLEPDGEPLTGLWSGGSRTWIAAQDLRVLRHILEAQS